MKIYILMSLGINIHDAITKTKILNTSIALKNCFSLVCVCLCICVKNT
jgi:hypothetical protein